MTNLYPRHLIKAKTIKAYSMSTSRHPKGLYLIFATSTAERFSYYGMRAIFILFLTQHSFSTRSTPPPSTAATPDWCT